VSVYKSRVLAILGGGLSLVASLVFSLAVTRRLPPEDLAVLNLVNSAYAIGTNIMAYVTAWYPRILARNPGAYEGLFAAGLLTAGIAWAAAVGYLFLFLPYGAWDFVILVLLGVMFLLYAVPAGAYLSVHRQELAATLGIVSQAIKIGGALVIRLSPTVDTALLINILVSLPQALSMRIMPAFRKAIPLLVYLIRGVPFQSLILISAILNGLMQYVIVTAGGAIMLYYVFILLQLSKIVYPVFNIVTLMYGSLLATSNKESRALVDGALILFFYVVPAALMLKEPELLLAVLRPQELNNTDLLIAIKLYGITLLLSGIHLHASNVLLGFESKEVIILKDRPAKALLLDIAFFPVNAVLTYTAVSRLGIIGFVTTTIIWHIYSLGNRLYYLPIRRSLIIKLYFPLFVALIPPVLAPRLPLRPSINIVTTLAITTVYLLYIAVIVATMLIILSPLYRQIIRRIIKYSY